jgi:hypothetical protein
MTMIEESSAQSKWPKVIGTLGVVLGVLMVLDTLDDVLFRLFTNEEDWAGWVGANIARSIVVSMPPIAWALLSAVIQIGLGAYLVAGSLRLRRRQASGVEMCRTWAKVTVAWVIVSMGLALWWIGRIAGEFAGATQAQVESAALYGVALAALLLLAYPLFLLYWFSKDTIRAETASWAH